MDDFTEEVAALSHEEKAILASDSIIELGGGAIEEIDDSDTLGIFRDSREHRAAQDRLKNRDISHVVFGHTHEIVNGGLGGRLFNPGTWMHRLDLGSPAIRNRIRETGVTLDMLRDKSLFVVDRLAVHISPGETGQSYIRLVEVPSLEAWSQAPT